MPVHTLVLCREKSSLGVCRESRLLEIYFVVSAARLLPLERRVKETNCWQATHQKQVFGSIIYVKRTNHLLASATESRGKEFPR